MKYNQLGKSTLNVSEISFGCMSLSADQKQNNLLINKAFDAGINLFDTADLYDKGENESRIGDILKSRRDSVIIATKVGNQWRSDGSGWDWNPKKDYILAAADASLTRLKTEYIDLYQLHGGTIEDDIDETIEAFEILKKQGKIRYYGISSIRPNVIREYVKRSNMISVMMQYSLLDRRAEESCLKLLFENEIGVLARGSVAQGLLVDKPSKPYLNYSVEEIKTAANAIKNISKERSAAQTALKFTLTHQAVRSAVLGIRTLPQLEDALGTIHASDLTNNELLTLQKSLPVNTYEQHR